MRNVLDDGATEAGFGEPERSATVAREVWPPASSPDDAPLPPAPTARGRLRRAIVVLAVVIAVAGVGVIGDRVVHLLVAGTVGTWASGGAFKDLPPDVRDGFNHRIEAAAGDRLEGLSADAAEALVGEMTAAGTRRLDDARLARSFTLGAQGAGAIDVATCASISRRMFAGGAGRQAQDAIVQGLDTASLIEITEIGVEAFEAEARGSPAPRSVSQADFDAMSARLQAGMSADDLATARDMANDIEQTDAVACATARAYWSAGVRLAEHDRAILMLTGLGVTP